MRVESLAIFVHLILPALIRMQERSILWTQMENGLFSIVPTMLKIGHLDVEWASIFPLYNPMTGDS